LSTARQLRDLPSPSRITLAPTELNPLSRFHTTQQSFHSHRRLVLSESDHPDDKDTRIAATKPVQTSEEQGGCSPKRQSHFPCLAGITDHARSQVHRHETMARSIHSRHSIRRSATSGQALPKSHWVLRPSGGCSPGP
jgi:hypothetical protein